MLYPILNTNTDDRAADIIFVHGLNTAGLLKKAHAFTTWGGTNQQSDFWPCWLAEDLAKRGLQVGIWLLEYEASASEWFGSGMSLTDRATSVIDTLYGSHIGDRPIVFIAHSLGGLVIKQVLRRAFTIGKDTEQNTAVMTQGVIFLGTPHTGANIATIANKLGRLMRQTEALKGLVTNAPALRELSDWYTNNANDIGIKTRAYYEMKPMFGIGIIVDQTSADPHVKGASAVAVDADHMMLSGIVSRDVSHYHGILRFVEECLKNPASPKEGAANNYLGISSTNSSNAVAKTKSLRDAAWERYSESLSADLNEKIFSGAVSLREVYVPLRAYWERADVGSGYARIDRYVHYVHDEMRRWASSSVIEDPLRILCGGPGYGKSSFAKVFCEEINGEPHLEIRALYIPLQRLDLSSKHTAVDQINAYLKEYGFDFCDPFSITNDKTLLLLLDGIDELAMQGEDAKKAAITFVNELASAMQPLNIKTSKLRCLVCGRDIMVQSIASYLQLEDKVWHLVPYLWRESDDATVYQSPDGASGSTIRAEYQYGKTRQLLIEDQRAMWWRNYGKATDRGYDDVPAPLKIRNLESLTALPLLNYLLALSYEHNTRVFGEDTTRNDIYYDLIKRIHTRDWGQSGSGPRNVQTRGMSLNTFVRVLEEIARVAWHSGDTRTARVEDIEEACLRSNLLSEWKEFEARGREGLTRVFTAFYVRWREYGNGVVEFTHKSFGDYLVACSIVRAWNIVVEKMGRPDQTVEAVLKWLAICGPTRINPYILEFVKDEVSARNRPHTKWQGVSVRLLQHIIDYGFQNEVLPEQTSAKEFERQSRNAAEALLTIHSACALQTNKVGKFNWLHPRRLYLWLAFLQHEEPLSNVTNSLLNHIEFDGSNHTLYARGIDLSSAMLNGSRFVKIDMTGAALNDASLSDTNWEEAVLDGADMSDTNLTSATMVNCKLRSVTLDGADLQNADLEGVDLTAADLSGTKMRGTILSRAILTRAYLNEADMTNVKLENAQLGEAELVGAKLIQANLTNARMEGANLEGADLSFANMERADLSYCQLGNANLSHATLNWTKFTKASLGNVDVAEARFAGAYLQGVDLSKVVNAVKAYWNGVQMDSSTVLPPDFPKHKYNTQPHDLLSEKGVFYLVSKSKTNP